VAKILSPPKRFLGMEASNPYTKENYYKDKAPADAEVAELLKEAKEAIAAAAGPKNERSEPGVSTEHILGLLQKDSPSPSNAASDTSSTTLADSTTSKELLMMMEKAKAELAGVGSPSQPAGSATTISDADSSAVQDLLNMKVVRGETPTAQASTADDSAAELQALINAAKESAASSEGRTKMTFQQTELSKAVQEAAALHGLGNYQAALDTLDKVTGIADELKDDAARTILHTNRGAILVKLERLQDAAEALNVAASFGSNAQLHNDRGVLYMQLENFGAALSAFDLALKHDSTLLTALCGRSQSLVSLARFQDAVLAADAVINADSSSIAGHKDRAYARIQLEDFDGVLSDVAKAEELGCKEAIKLKNWRYIAVSKLALKRSAECGSTDAAIQVVDRALEESGADLGLKELQFQKALLLLHADRLPAATDCLREALALNPTDFNIMALLGGALVTQKQYADAVPFLETAGAAVQDQATQAVDRVTLMQHTGRALMQVGRTADAAAKYQQVCSSWCVGGTIIESHICCFRSCSRIHKTRLPLQRLRALRLAAAPLTTLET
jgi:tetratricopeptide (TPR) repeat protein